MNLNQALESGYWMRNFFNRRLEDVALLGTQMSADTGCLMLDTGCLMLDAGWEMEVSGVRGEVRWRGDFLTTDYTDEHGWWMLDA